jgi:hypothetical protein
MEYKNYLIESDRSFGYKFIKPIGKGSIHMSLRGFYTSQNEAMKAIDIYNNQKGIVNGEANIST